MRRRTAAVALVVVALVALHALLSLPVAPARGMATDFVDPVRGALRVLGGDWWPLGTAIHGWGRDASFVPLVAGIESWVEHGWRRAWLQCWVPVAAFLAARTLLADDADEPGGLVGPLLAAAMLSANETLGHVISGTFQGYVAMEWAALMALGVAGLLRGVRPRLSGLATGVGATMAVFNTPYALALAAVGAVAVAVAWRRGDRAAAALAVGAAVALMAPHLYLLATAPTEVLYPYEVTGDLLDRMRQKVGEEGFTWLSGLGGYVEGLRDPVGLALSAGVFLALVGLASPRTRSLGLAALGILLAIPLGTALSMWVTHTKPWHVTPLLPFGAMVVGAGLATLGRRLAGRRVPLGVGTVVAVLAAAWLVRDGAASRQDRVDAAEGSIRADHLDRVGRMLARGGVDVDALAELGGDLRAQQPWQLLLLPVLLRGDQPGAGDVLYVQGGAPHIDAVRAVPAPGRLLGAGADWIVWAPASVARARRWTTALCAAAEREDVRAADPGLPSVLLLGDGENRRGSLHPCAWGGERPAVDGGWLAGGWLGEGRAPERFDMVLFETLEASNLQWRRCVEDGGCAGGPASRDLMPALVRSEDARAYCRWRGGRLPRRAEWLAATMPTPRWEAPPPVQADGAAEEIPPLRPVGTHPDGVSHWSVEDLADNAPEWVVDAAGVVAVWGERATPRELDRAGFRCVYAE